MAKLTETAVIIVPTYNEKGNIERLIDALYEDIFPTIDSHYVMHILVVDDTSPDGTGEIVKQKQKKHMRLHLLVNPEKAGLGNAYTKGMNYALDKLQADIVFEFDADFSHDPNKIPEFLAQLDKQADLVLGSRYIPGGSIPDNWGWHRKFMSIVGNMVIRIVMTDFSIHDWTTGFRAIRSSVVKKVLPELDDSSFMGYTFQIGFLHNTLSAGYEVAEVPINFVDRTMGKSKIGSEYIINTLMYIFKVRLKEITQHRIFKFVVVGSIGAMVQLVSLQYFRRYLPYQLAYFASIELAVISNFIWSNLWTFADRKLKWTQIPYKVIQFNLASAGSIIIQQIIAFVGENTIGLHPLFTLPILGITIDTGLVFAVVGILVGMTWNFLAYSRIIWRAKKKRA